MYSGKQFPDLTQAQFAPGQHGSEPAKEPSVRTEAKRPKFNVCNNTGSHQEGELWALGTENRNQVFSSGSLSSFCCLLEMPNMKYIKDI